MVCKWFLIRQKNQTEAVSCSKLSLYWIILLQKKKKKEETFISNEFI